MPVPIVTMVDACFGSRAMRHPWWQSSDGIDLRQAGCELSRPAVDAKPTRSAKRYEFRRARPPGAVQRRISVARTIGGGDAHRVFTAAQNCSVTAAFSLSTSQPFVSAFCLANLYSIWMVC